jgi:hypothetical protein
MDIRNGLIINQKLWGFENRKMVERIIKIIIIKSKIAKKSSPTS